MERRKGLKRNEVSDGLEILASEEDCSGRRNSRSKQCFCPGSGARVACDSKNPQLFSACQGNIERCFKHPKPHVRWFAAKVAAASGGCAASEALAMGLLDDGEVGNTTAQVLLNLGSRGVPAIKSFCGGKPCLAIQRQYVGLLCVGCHR